jgi:hypothetical protein
MAAPASSGAAFGVASSSAGIGNSLRVITPPAAARVDANQ